MPQSKYEIAARAANIMGLPATPELVLARCEKRLTYPNLIDALWTILKEDNEKSIQEATSQESQSTKTNRSS